MSITAQLGRNLRETRDTCFGVPKEEMAGRHRPCLSAVYCGMLDAEEDVIPSPPAVDIYLLV